MSSWVSLLVLLAACVRFVAAEGDPLPAALVELVRTSPISSIEDLQLLLFSDSVGEDADSQSTDGPHANSSYIRLPRSLEAQPAQQAQCKVRTEVTEVTRGMLDRSNANFLLWPPCVEVQRCSGCCNTKSLHCVPVLTHTRYLQVMRIQYINKRPHYDKAVVSVSDHVECRCEPAPRSAGGSKKKHRQGHKERAGKSHTKEELHRQDQLKHNQRVQLHDLLKGSPWQDEGDTSLKSPLGWGDAGGMGAGEGDLLLPETVHHGKKVAPRPHGSQNETMSVQAGRNGESEVRGHRHGDGGRRWGHHSDQSVALESSTSHPQHHPETPSEDGGGYHVYTHSTEEEHGVETQIYHPVQHHRHDLSKMAAAANKKLTQANQTNQSAAHHLSPTHRQQLNQSEDDNQNHKATGANQTHGQRISPTEVTNHSGELKDNPTQAANQWTEDRPIPTELTNQRATGNETPDSERKHEGGPEEEGKGEGVVEEEKRELLLLHRRLDQEKELLKRQRQQEEHLLHTPAQQHTTTIRTDTTAPPSPTKTTTTTTTPAPARPHRPRVPPRPPPRPHPHPHPSKRRRKHRNRISKAAMRAMLM